MQEPGRQKSLAGLIAVEQNRAWFRLCTRFVPLGSEESIWRFSRMPIPTDPSQGWKLHVSATVLTAGDVLTSVGPMLTARGALFKAPGSLLTLMRLNSGIFYGYSQIGKFITIYPRDQEDFVTLLDLLRPLVKQWPSGPVIPFDLRYKHTCIYYRYGAFRTAKGSNRKVASTPKVVSPSGEEIEDRRDAVSTDLGWLSDPLSANNNVGRPKRGNPLTNRYVVFRALAQRGKGGVYECVDMQNKPPRACILKEGRSGGETAWDGRDGRWLIKNETRVLTSLETAPHTAPRVLDHFAIGRNEYLVLEKIDGIDLSALLLRHGRHLSLQMRLEIGRQMSEILETIHNRGWIWRDCKPANFMVDLKGGVKAIDLEGACRGDRRRDTLPWSTPLFSAPELQSRGMPISDTPSREQDLFAFGVCLFQLITGTGRVKSDQAFETGFSNKTPRKMKDLILDLLSQNPKDRPGLADVKRALVLACGAAISDPSPSQSR